MAFSTACALLLCGLIGLSLGLMGGGGSILAVPVLVYVAGFEMTEAIPISLAIVGACSLLGSLLHWRRGHVVGRAALLLSSSGAVGAVGGARLTPLVSEKTLMFLFASLLLCVALWMLRHKREEMLSKARSASALRTLLVGFVVGGLTGFLGVGGGFLIVPALTLFSRLPMHHAVGTSLLVIAINSTAGFLGHLGESPVQLGTLLSFVIAAGLGVFAGESLNTRYPADVLRRVFAWFALLVAILLLLANHS